MISTPRYYLFLLLSASILISEQNCFAASSVFIFEAGANAMLPGKKAKNPKTAWARMDEDCSALKNESHVIALGHSYPINWNVEIDLSSIKKMPLIVQQHWDRQEGAGERRTSVTHGNFEEMPHLPKMHLQVMSSISTPQIIGRIQPFFCRRLN
ncbi:MAG: hypothetical protein AAF391_08125 [Bacteroidota bacterium]